MLQIVFNEISAAEISRIPTLEQLELLGDFKVTESTLENIDGSAFAKIEKDGRSLYRFRTREHRIYFEVQDNKVIVHRVLDKNSIADFLFRAKLSNVNEDEALSNSKHFWKLIDEGQNAKRK